MAEHPILFSGEMVQAILNGRKTQTRRVITERWQMCRSPEDEPEWFVEICPYGKPGDRLWVRETFQIVQPWGAADGEWIGDDIMEIDGRLGHDKPESFPYWWQAVYKADGDWGVWWRPSIFMPRWASRITLEIASIRVEKVQEISYQDILAEGFHPDPPGEPIVISTPGITVDGRITVVEMWHEILRGRFAVNWNKLNAKRGYSWQSNPWVWVLEFKL